MNMDKERICRTINKIFDKLTDFYNNDKTLYFIDDDLEDFNKCVEELHETKDEYKFVNYDSNTKYKILFNIYKNISLDDNIFNYII